MQTEFEWDEDKAKINLEKHGVSFVEGATIFNDEFVASLLDPDHSDDEDRFIAIGMSVKGRLLIAAFTERRHRTRIISCRKATPTERKIYEESE
jgi:hypothetical protein